jgi:hypothetical protein
MALFIRSFLKHIHISLKKVKLNLSFEILTGKKATYGAIAPWLICSSLTGIGI